MDASAADQSGPLADGKVRPDTGNAAGGPDVVSADESKHRRFAVAWESLVGGGLLGIVATVGIEVWRSNVESPQLAVSVDVIEREIDPKATVSVEQEELKILREFAGSRLGRLPGVSSELDEHPSELSFVRASKLLSEAEVFSKRRAERLKETEGIVQQVKDQSPENLTLVAAEGFNEPLLYEVDLATFEKSTGPGKIAAAAVALEEFRRAYLGLIEKQRKEVAELRDKVAKADAYLSSKKAEFVQENSVFIVTASAVNTGKQQVSLKETALLRVNIGTGNYVDVRLLLERDKDNANVPDYGNRVIRFTSSPISDLPDQDTILINNYWEQSVKAVLFAEDSLGIVHASFPIEFSSALNRKRAYDKLANAASEHGDDASAYR